ncbi:MAG: hypothetical protein PUD59_02810 [bacterium]|nr:hypothetical protein [bacterium]
MKKILYILVCCFMILGLTGCGTNKNDFEIGNESTIKTSEKGISLSVKKGTLTNTGATLVLRNNSDLDAQYGYPYEIEIKKDGKWYKINVEIDFILPAFGLKSKETKEIELNWENGYGQLSPGEYRIIKSIGIEKDDGALDSFYVSAEFNIK